MVTGVRINKTVCACMKMSKNKKKLNYLAWILARVKHIVVMVII